MKGKIKVIRCVALIGERSPVMPRGVLAVDQFDIRSQDCRIDRQRDAVRDNVEEVGVADGVGLG